MTVNPHTSEKRYEDIFNNLAVPILEEDISAVRKAIDDLKAQGVSDFIKYLDENPDFVRRASLTIKIIDANDAAMKLYGANSKAELLGSLDKIFVQQSYDVLKQELLAIAEGRKYFEAEDVNFNLRGERIDIWLHASIPPEKSELKSRLLSIIDITARKKAVNRLALQYDITRVLAESGGIEKPIEEIIRLVCESNSWVIGEIWLVDRQADVLRLESLWNKPSPDTAEFEAVSRKTSFRKGEGLPGRAWESGQPAWISDVINDGNFLRTPAASRLGLHAAFAFPIKSSGKVIGAMSFFSQRFETPDNDFLLMFDAIGAQIGAFLERKQMEQEIEKTHKLEAIGTLAGGIAHDFNNLLTAILGNISLTKMHMRPDDKDFMRLTDAENACMQATELSKRLIIFSKGGDPVRRAISTKKLVDETICSALSGSNISCECKLLHDLNPVYADEGQIRQVFRNMAINAREAMPDGGVISVTAENITLGEGEIAAFKKGNYVKVSIRDSGRGMPEEILPKIFDPYFTTKEMGVQRGLGLGLAVCYSIIKKHGGHISVESKIGEGTTFHTYLPAVEAEIKEHGIAKTQLPGKKRVLIMDDAASVRNVAGQILEHLGYEVEYAGDGNEAIETYKKTKESGKVFDAVILDLTVQGGMGGDLAIGRLLNLDPDVRAIVSSGYADSPVMTDFKKYGFAGAIAKPYGVEQLKEVLDKVIAG
jgi:PAS domain S-box-containing protein